MTRAILVLVDTGVWSAFFSKPSSREKRALDVLLDQDRVLVTGPVLAEVLRGFDVTLAVTWGVSQES